MSGPDAGTSECDRANPRVRVAFQGEIGAYGDAAIAQQWGGAAEPIPSATFNDVVTAVASGKTEYGVIPVWNTIVGDVEVGCAAMELALGRTYRLVTTGMVEIAVRHQLLALPGVAFDDINSVASHPVALAQCALFLALHPRLVPRAVHDTAGAARDLALSRTRTSAVIASKSAGERYGLAILQPDVQGVPDNVTRFAIITRPTAATESRRW